MFILCCVANCVILYFEYSLDPNIAVTLRLQSLRTESVSQCPLRICSTAWRCNRGQHQAVATRFDGRWLARA